MVKSSAQLPSGAILKDISAWINQDTLPRALQAFHSLAPAQWAQVVVEDGEVNLYLDGSKTPIAVSADTPAAIAPETPFRLESAGKPVRFCLRYYHEPRVTDAAVLAGELGGRVR